VLVVSAAAGAVLSGTQADTTLAGEEEQHEAPA
jgi:pyruvate dehydrogenase complex dehydrogenase (E1) component